MVNHGNEFLRIYMVSMISKFVANYPYYTICYKILHFNKHLNFVDQLNNKSTKSGIQQILVNYSKWDLCSCL